MDRENLAAIGECGKLGKENEFWQDAVKQKMILDYFPMY